MEWRARVKFAGARVWAGLTRDGTKPVPTHGKGQFDRFTNQARPSPRGRPSSPVALPDAGRLRPAAEAVAGEPGDVRIKTSRIDAPPSWGAVNEGLCRLCIGYG